MMTTEEPRPALEEERPKRSLSRSPSSSRSPPAKKPRDEDRDSDRSGHDSDSDTRKGGRREERKRSPREERKRSPRDKRRRSPEEDRSRSPEEERRRLAREERHRSAREDRHMSSRDGRHRSPREERSRYSRDDRREKREERRRSPRSDRRRSPRDDRRRSPEQERRRSLSPSSDAPAPVPKPKDENVKMLTTRTGGAYIPPARLRAMQAAITDKSSQEYQRIAWEALRKSVNGLINKVNVSNIRIIVIELFKENLIRGRGLLCRSVIQAQTASPTFTHVYAALVAVINSKFPQIGELVLRRLINQFKRSYKRNDKMTCLSTSRFLAHLVNQEVAHEVIALELLTLMLENCTNDSIEVAVAFMKEVGMKLAELSPRGVHAIFERLRSILHEGVLDKRVQYMIEVLFAIRKDGFKDHPSKVADLDLVEEADQFTHLLSLDQTLDDENVLNVFRHDPDYEANENKYKEIKKEILDESSSDEDDDDDEEEEEEEDEETEDKEGGDTTIFDKTETNLISLRRTIYLTIQSSLDFEECAHKLLKLEIPETQVTELCHMIIDCCAQQRTYMKFYGLLAQRFCQMSNLYVVPFTEIFKSCYDTIHRFETNKLRNVAKIFAHLLYTDAIPWLVLGHIKLNEDDTTSSSRVFIKILFQELAEYMGLQKLNDRIKDPTLADAFAGLFPRDNPRNTRFAINFFTTVGLGGLTDDLREHLKVAPKPAPNLLPQAMLTLAQEVGQDSDSGSSSSSSSSDSSSSSSEESSSESESDSKSDSDSDGKKRKKDRKRKSSKKKSRSKKRSKETKESKKKTHKKHKSDSKSEKAESKKKREESKEKERHKSSRKDKSRHKTR